MTSILTPQAIREGYGLMILDGCLFTGLYVLFSIIVFND